MAVLILPAFITRVEADINIDSYPYKVYMYDTTNGIYYVFLSNQSITTDSRPTIPTLVTDFNYGTTYYLRKSGYYLSTPYVSGNKPLLLSYNTSNEWTVYVPVTDYERWFVYRSGTFSTTKPAGFPEIDLGGVDLDAIYANVQSMIDSSLNTSLNATTSTTTTANNLNSQVSTAYTNYANGTITASALQSQLDSIKSQLQTLMNKSTNTISDRLNVQNTLTYTQIVQDVVIQDNIIAELEEDLKVSSSVSTAITGKINEANQTFTNYSQGSVSQSEAVTQINQYITYLTSLISSETPTADIEAINAGINTINGIKESITSYSDLDSGISDSAQNSDQAELDYLEKIMSETTSTIQDMSPEKKFSSQQISSGNNILAIVWDNEIINRIIPLAACFMVVCVALGIRYKL